jgi:hypothetical protein
MTRSRFGLAPLRRLITHPTRCKFLQELKKSKRVAIEASFYQDGTRIMEFDVSGLIWEESKSPTKKAK